MKLPSTHDKRSLTEAAQILWGSQIPLTSADIIGKSELLGRRYTSRELSSLLYRFGSRFTTTFVATVSDEQGSGQYITVSGKVLSDSKVRNSNLWRMTETQEQVGEIDDNPAVAVEWQPEMFWCQTCGYAHSICVCHVKPGDLEDREDTYWDDQYEDYPEHCHCGARIVATREDGYACAARCYDDEE